MYKIKYTHKFVKAVRKCVKRGLDIKKLGKVVSQLEQNGVLPQQYHPHKLVGKIFRKMGMPHFTRLVAHLGAE